MNDNKSARTSAYDRYLNWIKENQWAVETMQTKKINAEEIECIKYNKTVMGSVVCKGSWEIILEKEILYYPDGRVVIFNKIDNFEEVNSKKELVYSPEKIQKMFKDVAGFISEKSLKLSLFYDDAIGKLSICFKDGHIEKYDRGMSDGKDCLEDYIIDLDNE